MTGNANFQRNHSYFMCYSLSGIHQILHKQILILQHGYKSKYIQAQMYSNECKGWCLQRKMFGSIQALLLLLGSCPDQYTVNTKRGRRGVCKGKFGAKLNYICSLCILFFLSCIQMSLKMLVFIDIN